VAAASEPDPQASETGAPRRWRRLLYVPAVLAWLALSGGGATEGSESGAETAGRIFGALALPLVLAMLLRLLYVKVLVRSRRRPFLSPWIFVIAAAVGLLASIGRISGDA
jgi:hypothetical protein